MTIRLRQQLRSAYSDVRDGRPANFTATHTSKIDEDVIPELIGLGFAARHPAWDYGCCVTQAGIDYVRAAWPGMLHAEDLSAQELDALRWVAGLGNQWPHTDIMESLRARGLTCGAVRTMVSKDGQAILDRLGTPAQNPS